MGLTVSRKTAKNLAVRRKNERILTVSHYKILTVNRKCHYPIEILLLTNEYHMKGQTGIYDLPSNDKTVCVLITYHKIIVNVVI